MDETLYLERVAFDVGQGTVELLCDSMTIRTTKEQDIFEFLDGRLEVPVRGVWLTFELSFNVAEAPVGAVAQDWVEILNRLTIGDTVYFHPVFSRLPSVRYAVRDVAPTRTHLQTQRGSYAPRLELNLQLAQRLDTVPLWLKTQQAQADSVVVGARLSRDATTIEGYQFRASAFKPDVINTPDYLYIPMLEDDGGDAVRRLVRWSKYINRTETTRIQTIEGAFSSQYNPCIYAEKGRHTLVVGGYWSGAPVALQEDHLSYWFSKQPDGMEFGDEKIISYAGISVANQTPAYPVLNVYKSTVLIAARLPQTTSDRHWGLRVSYKYPFEPNDLKDARMLIEADGDHWWYPSTYQDQKQKNIWHWVIRPHSSQSQDNNAYYFYMDMETGFFYGENGAMANAFTGDNLPLSTSDMWQLPLDTGERILVYSAQGNGGMTEDSPVIVPFTELTATAPDEFKTYIAKIYPNEKNIEQLNIGNIGILRMYRQDNFCIMCGKLHETGNQLRFILSDDFFETIEQRTISLPFDITDHYEPVHYDPHTQEHAFIIQQESNLQMHVMRAEFQRKINE